MVKAKYFGTYKKEFGISEDSFKAGSVSELLKAVADKYNKDIRAIESAVIFVNDISINQLEGYKTKLKDKDEVLIISPASMG
ncbi:MAG: MoaD/ThiS family protein [Firmicutes bacterium]|nr:MoaD/ThiS family protein [Bacillota bacterium]